MKYSHIVAAVCSRAWAMREETVWAMQNLIRLQALGEKWTAEEIRERIAVSNAATGFVPNGRAGSRFLCFEQEMEMEAASGKRKAAAPGSVALIPVRGVISHRMNLMGDISGPGGTSIEKLTADFRQAVGDGNCKAIVLDVDSPGGSVEGVMELAAEIFDARKEKPITAVCNAMACSAAYWLAAAAGDVVCIPSGQCGSIGVYMMHQDESKALEQDGIKITIIKAGKYKAEGNPSEPLSPEAYEAFLGKVNDYYGMFVKAVAQYRGASQAAVRDGFGQGRSLLATDAVKQNLADRVATLDDVLSKYGVKNGSQPSSMSSQEHAGAGARATQAKTNPDDDTDEDEPDACGCTCAPCEACENKTAGSKARADDMSCKCDCEACKACAFKSAAAITIRQTAAREEATARAAGAGLAAVQRRRRQLSLS